jgi:hypothetical protein
MKAYSCDRKGVILNWSLNMTRWIFLAVLAAAMLYEAAAAQERGFGLGIILGEPTGISAKQWITDNNAIAGAVAWSLGKHDALQLHADYLIHNFPMFKPDRGKLPLYYGLGGRIKFQGDEKVGLRIPLGMSYIFADAPLDFFLEIVPLFDIAPSTKFDLNAAIGARYQFGWRRPMKY